MDMDDDEDELELCPCGGVAFRQLTAGGSAFSGLWESSEMPPLPLPLTAGGAAADEFVGGLWVCVCSVDLGEGVAVDMAEIGEEAAEVWAWGVEGVTAGWMLLTFLFVSVKAEDEDPSDWACSGSFPPANRAESLGLSALRLAVSPPPATFPPSAWT